ncbi:MAG: globin [Ilumatobacteraceae bacterium]|nr:globin [Ilumatobacteraceae bacterium]
MSLFEEVGGSQFFDRLVERFYEGVATDDVLLPLYPEQSDLSGAKERLTLFLQQYWGGPTTYSDERGHPRLRQRHFPFVIGELERDRWMVHMMAAVDELSPNETVHQQLMEYMAMASTAMINSPSATI